MDQAPPSQQDIPNGPLIDAGAALAFWLVGRLREQLAHPARAFGAAFLRHLFRHYLLPAESAVRRALYLLADTLNPEPPRPAAQSAQLRVPERAAPQSPARPRTPAFRLTEPQPRPPTNHLPLALRPRISVPGVTPTPPPPAPRRTPDPVALEDRLQRRLAALDAVFRDPVSAARRLLRWLVNRPPTGPLLAYAKIPGLTAKPLGAPERTTLDRLNQAVIDAFRRGADTS